LFTHTRVLAPYTLDVARSVFLKVSGQTAAEGTFEAPWEASQEFKGQAPHGLPPSSLESQEMKIWLGLGKFRRQKIKPEG
jgi:hypothetical protein